jgi:hypothetical protein
MQSIRSHDKAINRAPVLEDEESSIWNKVHYTLTWAITRLAALCHGGVVVDHGFIRLSDSNNEATASRESNDIKVTESMLPHFESLDYAVAKDEIITMKEFRKRCKFLLLATHPDKGGNREAFIRVDKAIKAIVSLANGELPEETVTESEETWGTSTFSYFGNDPELIRIYSIAKRQAEMAAELRELREGFREVREGFQEVREGFQEVREGFQEVREGFQEVRRQQAKLRGRMAILRGRIYAHLGLDEEPGVLTPPAREGHVADNPSGFFRSHAIRCEDPLAPDVFPKV